jgi:hypothetical protein
MNIAKAARAYISIFKSLDIGPLIKRRQFDVFEQRQAEA